MPKLNSLTPEESATLFNEAVGHAPVCLSRLPRARVAWLNRRVMRDDPAFAGSGATAEGYAAHILRKCAFCVEGVDGTQVGNTDAIGVADRYGGPGIGRHGGGGRAVWVNGYYVKGVGATPLCSKSADENHGSGRTYLEESVRETVFSELAAIELPFGAIPTIAIIETGGVHVWEHDIGPRPARYCLMVRPGFLRPAHFERAPGYITGNPKEGYFDALRVRHMFERCIALWSESSMQSWFEDFWERWAAQLAYGFVHRLSFGGCSTSNMCLNGSLLDFGGTAAMPSWAQISVAPGALDTGMEMFSVAQALHGVVPFLDRYLKGSYKSKELTGRILRNAAQRYNDVLMLEMLRIAGLTRRQAASFLADRGTNALTRALSRLLTHFRREHIATFDSTPSLHFEWDVGRLWADKPPTHLVELRDILRRMYARSCSSPRTSVRMCATAALRCKQRSLSRELLYRERIAQDAFTELDGSYFADPDISLRVGKFVANRVALSRRDGLHEPDDAVAVGYAQNEAGSYALFHCLRTGRRFAIEEWTCGSRERNRDSERAGVSRLAISEMSDSYIAFSRLSLPPFEGTVALTDTEMLGDASLWGAAAHWD